VDLAAPIGSEVVAPAAGVVHYAGWVGDRFLVAIDHGAGVISSIEPIEPSVATGAEVGRGEPIGRVAEGAHCVPGCVHFGVRVDGVYVSPLLMLGGLPRSVLLPLSRRAAPGRARGRRRAVRRAGAPCGTSA
jgi:murein DD-endopeptidase MepM/ murein hydrolase activator NlpD